MTKIVLIAGRVKPRDRTGHHDYLGGCVLLGDILARTPELQVSVVRDGWPDADASLEDAAAVLFYDGGMGKQAFLASTQRIALLQRLLERGMGLSIIHQATAFPPALDDLSRAWLGAVYRPGLSARGHWTARHRIVADHPVTRGVTPWESYDGWLYRFDGAPGGARVTPLLSSGNGVESGDGMTDVVSWAYERPGGGRSFVFTGLDAHCAWSSPDLRRLMLNGVLWTAKHQIPAGGTPNAIETADVSSYLTPRARRSVFGIIGKAMQGWSHRRSW